MYGYGYDDTKKWTGSGSYKYDEAKRTYLESLKAAGGSDSERTYIATLQPDMDLVDPKDKTEVVSLAKFPIGWLIDGTGSMAQWPAAIFDRLPLAVQTLGQYQWDDENNVPDVDFCFSVIGDAQYDKWPVQTGKFERDTGNEKYLKALHGEGGGGPGIRESYELWAYFVNERFKTPNAVDPTLIIMGDEKFYDAVDPDQVKRFLGGGLQGPVDSKEVWRSLTQKYDVWFLQKPYPGRDEEVRAQWADAIGPQKIVPVHDPERVVDVAIGLIAKKWGKTDDFLVNLGARQDSENIETVMQSLRAVPGATNDMKSTYGSGSELEKSISLTEEKA